MGKMAPRKSSKRSKVTPARTRTVKPAPPSRTPLGEELRKLRAEIIKSGIPLLTMDQIRAELRSQRRERE